MRRARTSGWSRRGSAARPCERCSKSSGVPGVRDVRIPAGLDLGARTAPEVALSILAEIVQVASERRVAEAVSRSAAVGPSPGAGVRPTAIDPVCGMSVDVGAGAPHGGARRRHLLLLLRELPVEFLKEPARVSAPAHDRRGSHSRSLPRARLHRRRRVRDRAADRARAREAAARRGAGRRRQDREREGARRRARHAADPAAVLRRARCDDGALRVELSAADAARPAERGGRAPRSTSARRRSSASGSCSSGRCSRRSRRSDRRCCSSTKSIAPTRRSRRSCSKCWPSGR